MRTSRMFAYMLAALAVTACSNEDESPAGASKTIDALSVSLVSNSPSTRAVGEQEGLGSENSVYVAYVFAKEAKPEHENAKVGDWTVQRVAGDEAATDAEVTTAIEEGKVTDAGKLKNLASFKGVTQGDKIYVIVNDPNMSLAEANNLAHQGEASEEAIQAYVSSLSKEYLNGLVSKIDGSQKGKYAMMGSGVIPTGQTIPNGGTVYVPITLEREMAKVIFKAAVTKDDAEEAAGNIAVKENEDGIIVMRIPRKVSPFTTQLRDWYYPQVPGAGELDWNSTWPNKPFDGGENSDPTTAGTAFNQTVTAPTAKEYRMTWQLKTNGNGMTTINERVSSPYFYVTPNYADDPACSSVVLLQASYTGSGCLEPIVTEEMLASAFADNTVKNAVQAVQAGVNDYKLVTQTTWTNNSVATALLSYLQGQDAFQSTFIGKTVDNIIIKANDKRYYRADIAEVGADGASKKITERNTFYEIVGTITTLGARSADDAVKPGSIGMNVQVTVSKWKYITSNVNL